MNLLLCGPWPDDKIYTRVSLLHDTALGPMTKSTHVSILYHNTALGPMTKSTFPRLSHAAVQRAEVCVCHTAGLLLPQSMTTLQCTFYHRV